MRRHDLTEKFEFFWIYLWNFSGDNDDNEDNKDNEDSEDNKESEDREDNRDNEDSEENDNSEDNDIEKTPWILEICETLITFLAIENNNLIIHSDPWIKSERDSIRNSCDVFSCPGSSIPTLADWVSQSVPL